MVIHELLVTLANITSTHAQSSHYDGTWSDVSGGFYQLVAVCTQQTRCGSNVDVMAVHRLRRWPNQR